MSRSRFAQVTVAAAAAVALSACSGTSSGEPKPWPTAVGTGEVVAVPTSATVTDNWVGLPAAPVPDSQRDTTGHRFGPVAPGVGVWEHGAGIATDTGCTLGPVVAPGMSPVNRGYLTAGHCDKPDRTQVLAFSDAAHASPQFVGVYTPAPAGGRPVDAVSLWVAAGTSTPTSLAGHPVAGVLTKTAVSDPKLEGQPVCLLGAVSGLVCATLVTVDGDEISVDIPTQKGDSGSPLFMVNGNTNAVTLVGLLTDNSQGSTSYGVVADTALHDLGAKLVTDPSVAVDAGRDTRYSDQTVTAH